MPTVTQTPVEAYAHCVRPRCPGYEQAPVDAVRIEDAFTYAERGGDLPGIENSFVHLKFINDGSDGKPNEALCEHCGSPRDISEEPRHQYANLSGHNPDGLLDIEPFDPRKQVEIAQQPVDNTEREQMLSEIAELRGMVTALLTQKPVEPEGD